MTIKGSAILIVLVVSLASCSNRQTGEVSVKEDLIAKQLLQGIWVNDETEMPLMRIEGDTVYYANPQSAPVPFKVVHDTIYIYSNEPVAYKIDRVPAMEALRTPVDRLEMLVDKELWPMPSYGDLIFEV